MHMSQRPLGYVTGQQQVNSVRFSLAWLIEERLSHIGYVCTDSAGESSLFEPKNTDPR